MVQKKLSQIEQRKVKHIELASKDESQMSSSAFDGYELPYTALPEISLNDVDTSCKLLGKTLQQPLIIASMTGGAVHAEKINTNLAQAAQECGVALGVGSQRIMLSEKSARRSFEVVRKNAPDAVIFSNLGAVQLNYGITSDDVKVIIDAVQADALYLHLNPLQEALQPEGDTDFADLLPKIGGLVKSLSIPVFVKEVGHGISGEVAQKLIDVGVKGIDVAGIGGTSWAWIEAKRGNRPAFESWFKETGISTTLCITECAKICEKAQVSLVASGGVRSPIDGLKALWLGADYYSCAQPFLAAALSSTEDVIDVVKDWEDGLRIRMFTAGVSTL